jgi:hypothetical protein
MGSSGFPSPLLELDAVKFAPVRYDYPQGRKDEGVMIQVYGLARDTEW